MSERPKKSYPVFRNLLWVVFGIFFFLSGIWFLVIGRLADIVSWGFSKAVPGAVLDLKDLRISSFNHLVVGRLVIRDEKSGEELLKMDGGTAAFSFQGLSKLKISEVRLMHPMISVSPHLIRLFSSSDRSKKSNANSKPFPIGLMRVVCEEGNIRLHDMGKKVPEINAKFSFDFRDLSFASSQVPQSIILWAISAKGPSATTFLELDRMEATFTLDTLIHSHLERIRVQGGKLIIGKELRSLVADSRAQAASSPSTTSPRVAPLPAWTMGAIDIFRVMVALEEENPGMSHIHFQLTTRLKDITLGDAANSLGSTLQTVQLSHIALKAPSSGRMVMKLNTVFIRFTLQNLLREQIEEVVVLYPTIYLSEDLFAYMDSTSQPVTKKNVPSASVPGWIVRRLRVDFGSLIIGGSESGDGGVGLPVKFETDIRNIALDNLAALKIKAKLHVPEENYEFASYQLEFKSKSGEMRFAYPPEKGTNNVVTVLNLSHLRWRQYHFQEPWIGVTFDGHGINGQFGAKAYKGYISGGFSFLFGSSSPWSGWVSGRKVDLSRLTRVISPENLTMTGPLNLALQLNAHGPRIERVKGEFYVGTPGKMHVGKIESLLRELPKDWPAIKRSAATIALETLRDFEYKKALGDFWFVDSQGIFNLNVSGPTGSRKFQFLVHTNNHSSIMWNSSSATQ